MTLDLSPLDLSVDTDSRYPTKPDDVLHVNAVNPLTLQDELARAVRAAQETAALGGRHGLLLTRHSESLFTVGVSPDVPYGTTIEKDDWQPTPASIDR